MDAARAEGDGFPALHAGVAYGPALQRWGDWYGGTVNLAARLAESARAGTVLTDARVRERTDDPGLAWADAGAKALPGVTTPVETYTVQRSPIAPDERGRPGAPP